MRYSQKAKGLTIITVTHPISGRGRVNTALVPLHQPELHPPTSAEVPPSENPPTASHTEQDNGLHHTKGAPK